jgi:hypothetical protein
MTRFWSHAIPRLLAPFLVVTALLSGAEAGPRDLEVLGFGNSALLCGVQFHNFSVEEGGSRPDFSLTTFQLTWVFR